MRVTKVNGVEYPITINARLERLFKDKTGKWFVEVMQDGRESANLGTAAALVWAACSSRGPIKETFEDFEILDLDELLAAFPDIAAEFKEKWSNATGADGPLVQIVDLVISTVKQFQSSAGGLSGRLEAAGLESLADSTSTPPSGT